MARSSPNANLKLAWWGQLAVVWAILSVGVMSCDTRPAKSVSSGPTCEVDLNIDPQVRMRLLDLGARAARALYFENWIQLAMMKRIAEDDQKAALRLAKALQGFWQPNLALDSGKLAFLVFFKTGPKSWQPCRIGKARILEVRAPLAAQGKPFAVLGYTFVNEAYGFLLVLTAHYELGGFVLGQIEQQQVKAGGRTAADLTAAAELAETHGDRLLAKLFYQKAARMEPNGKFVRSHAALELERKAQTLKVSLPSATAPLQFPTRVWAFDLIAMRDRLLLKVVFEHDELTESSVRPAASKLLEQVLTEHRLLPRLVDAVVFEARPLPPTQPGDFFRVVFPLNQNIKGNP